MKNTELAKTLARAIFEMGAWPHPNGGSTGASRIQFKGALAHGSEVDLGGLNEDALERVIARTLIQLQVDLGKAAPEAIEK